MQFAGDDLSLRNESVTIWPLVALLHGTFNDVPVVCRRSVLDDFVVEHVQILLFFESQYAAKDVILHSSALNTEPSRYKAPRVICFDILARVDILTHCS